MTLAHAYARFLRRVLSWARFAGVNDEDTDDIAQEVFCAFATGGHAVADRAVPSWLRTTTERIARRHLAKLARRGAGEPEGTEPAGAEDLAAPGPSPERRLAAREAERLLLDLIDELPPEQREVFLRHAAGETLERIAAALGWSKGTTHTRFELAKKHLREAIGRVRAAEKRTSRGGTSLGLLPWWLPGRVASRWRVAPRWRLTLASCALGVAALLVVITLCREPPALAPDPAEALSADPPPIFAPPVSFLLAPREQEARPIAPPRPAPPLPPQELPELELVSLARHALLEGSPARARALLARADRAYPQGALLPERAALAARAGSR